MLTAQEIRDLAKGSIVGFAKALLVDATFMPDNRSRAQRFDYWKHPTGTRYKLGRKCIRKVHDGKRVIDFCFTPRIQAWMKWTMAHPIPSEENLLANWEHWCLFMKAVQAKGYVNEHKPLL
jgi:hypothetical protein